MRIAFRVPVLCGAALLLALTAAVASAQDSGFAPNAFSSPTTRVPVSALGRPAAWFDPSRLHITQSFSMGTGFGGGSAGLSVTSFSYQFARPLSMSVNIGNAFGAGPDAGKFFLEGMNVRYQPSANSMIQFEYHDFRSPLQYQAYRGGMFSPGPWGY